MASITAEMEISEPNAGLPTPPEEPSVKLRSYQQEMLEVSLQRNVIVAMDTGSGKTHVAAFRILTYLESCPDATKLVWFMSPSVALSSQQFDRISELLPSYLVKTLTGNDGVDKWTDQRLWDAVLANVRVVVGTPAVLSEALTHGFVDMSRIGLLVFDEAHNCNKNSPMNLIMRNFYHPAKAKGDHIPAILGLTASPVMSTKTSALATIEANLDAVAVTPKRTRSELEMYVHPPQVASIIYEDGPDMDASPSHQALSRVVEYYDLSVDPYIVELKAAGDDGAQRKLTKMVEKPKTYCYEQLKALLQRTTMLQEQLGAYAADWYLQECIRRFSNVVVSDFVVLPDIAEKERRHLASIFQNITCSNQDIGRHIQQHDLADSLLLTEKASKLANVLIQHASLSTRAIIFVEQRVVVTMLAHLLDLDPHVTAAYSIGTFVGTSASAKRKASVADLVELKQQQQDLSDFRNGDKNLIIATNVLEEGIDVTACNLVICFDPPKNLVSFVQRRGRARQKGSNYIVFLPAEDVNVDPSKWQRLEAEMKEAYMDEMRQFTPAEPEDEDAMSSRVYRVSSTGALLTLENAKAHLNHFCAISTLHKHADSRPEFDITNNGGPFAFTAHVTLPAFVHTSLRTAASERAWHSEATAVKDAAFQAYVNLHKAGLVNDNLLPLVKDFGPDEAQVHVDQPSIVEVAERMSSWVNVYRGVDYEDAEWHAGRLELKLTGESIGSMELWLPAIVPHLGPFNLHWNGDTTHVAEVQPLDDEILPAGSPALQIVREFTHVVMSAVHAARMHSDLNDFPVLLSDGSLEDLSARIRSFRGIYEATALRESSYIASDHGLVRVKGEFSRAYFFTSLLSPIDSDPEPSLTVTTFPKRRDFLHSIPSIAAKTAAYTSHQTFPLTACTIDKLPTRYALFAAFIPSIMYRLDIYLLAQHLQYTILRVVGVQDTNLIIQALSTPSAAEVGGDYNRLEFLGDSLLKFCTVLQVTAQHLNWPEGYLGLEKFRIVSNKTLARAALELGLDKYILTKPFTGSKWRPIYVSELFAAEEGSKREMSSKTLADVMEALIGAAFVDGGLGKAFTCIRTLLNDETWFPQPQALDRLLEDSSSSHQATHIPLLERLTTHNFTHPSLLLEALTHVSFPHNTSSLSYERLEFLGDAILDLIIVPKLFAHPRKLKHWEMHRIRGAIASGDFLAWCCMRYAAEEERFDVADEKGSPRLEVRSSTRQVHIHDFVRAAPHLLQSKVHSLATFSKFRPAIDEALWSGDHFPWSSLLTLRPQKFLADVVESVLGALYLDTRGDLAVCENFLNELGVLPYLLRVLDERVETAFPKEELGTLAGNERVEYLTTRSQSQDDAEPRTFICALRVASVEIVRVEGCGSREEAEAKAAREACEVLRARGTRKRKLDDEKMSDVE